jgi:hypothetical protein
MDVVTRVIVGLNAVTNVLGRWLLAPTAVLPGWLSATVAAVVTGVLLLAVFKWTSNQQAIKRVRDDINANLLALKLFKESALVALRAQGSLLVGAGRLFVLALVPMAVMTVPVLLVLGQLSLWYQQRPLHSGEEAVVTLTLNGVEADSFPDVKLQPNKGAETTLGPVRVQSKREVCWNIKAGESGYHRLEFLVGEQTVEKELAVGDGFMRVSVQRPGWHWLDVLTNPWEKPFRPESAVASISIDYPRRSSWTSGSDWWVGYWFIVSMVAAFAFRRALKVNV